MLHDLNLFVNEGAEVLENSEHTATSLVKLLKLKNSLAVYNAMSKNFERAFLRIKSFVKVQNSPTREDLFHFFLLGVGVICAEREVAFDLYIPFCTAESENSVVSEENVSAIFFQVKHHIDPLSQDDVNDWIRKVLKTKCVKNLPPFIAVLIEVNGSTEPDSLVFREITGESEQMPVSANSCEFVLVHVKGLTVQDILGDHYQRISEIDTALKNLLKTDTQLRTLSEGDEDDKLRGRRATAVYPEHRADVLRVKKELCPQH